MRHLLVSVIAVLALAEANAQQSNIPPKLLVSITIDQLRYDYIERFYPLFGEKGFKRLLKEGRVYKNGYQNFINPDIASSTASIYTGTTPSVHGIIGTYWYDAASDNVVNCVLDNNFMGNFIKNGYSPNKIMTSTIADELKISTAEKGIVYSIAAYPESAIIAGGRNANNALWINDENGKWCTSTYYKDIPYWVSAYNDSLSIDHRIDDIEWQPKLNCSKYKYITSEWSKEAFDYKFKNFKNLKFRKFLKSALVNEEINNMAEKCIANTPIAADDITDMLLLTYYAGNFDDKSTIECAYEIQDTYVRLDKELERIITLAEKKAGIGNVMFVISSTGYIGKEMADLKKYNIPTGEFYINRCAALLNMYLMAQYGEGNYVSGYMDNQIYLDHQLIKEKKLNLKEILDSSTEFLMTFSGVSDVYSSKRILFDSWAPDIQKWRNTYNRLRSGDIYFELLPGWSSRNENSYEYRIERANFTASPIIFWGNGIKGITIDTPVSNEIIAPTISYYLRIRAPNAAKFIPVTDLKL